MPKASVIQNSFTAGELSPQLLGRQDLQSYQAGLRTFLNAIALVQGAWTRRPGDRHLKTTKFGAARKSRLATFEVSATQAYAVEFGHLYLRLFLDGDIVTLAAQSIEGVTQADPGVLTITGHGYSDGDRLHLSNDIGGMHELRLREVIVANATTNTFELQDIDGNDLDTTGFDAFTSGGTVAEIVEEITEYTEDDIDDLHFVQTDQEMYVFHPSYRLSVLTRTSATVFSFAPLDLNSSDGPYLPVNTTATTLTPSVSGASTVGTLTASSTTGINDDQGFLSTDVLRVVRLRIAGTWGFVLITSRNSATEAGILTLSALGGTSATATWRLGLWSDTTGHPATGTFFEDRLWAAGSAAAPQRVDGSVTGVSDTATNFAPSASDGTVVDTNAISFTFTSRRPQVVQWLGDDVLGLIVGATGGEWIVRPSTESEALTPSNITARKVSGHGSSSVQAIDAGQTLVFVQRAARKIREFTTDARGNANVPDLSVLANHLFTQSVKTMSWQQEPQPVLWVTRTDGILLGFTFSSDLGALAWHRHQKAGVSDASGTHALVESVAAVSSAGNSRGRVYSIVTRRINGADRRDVELQTKIWEDGDTLADAVHLDSALTFNFSPASATVQGLSHLEGETVTIFADGATHPDRTVTNGEITLDADAATVTVGLSYQSDGLQLPVEAGSADGSAQGKTKRIQRVGFWLFDTLGLKFGPDANNLTEHFSREWESASWGEASVLFSGVVREAFEGDYDKLGQVFWRAEGPFPATVLAVMRQVQTEDDT